MNEEQRPLGGPDEQAPEQHAPENPEQPAALVNLENTTPIGNYPPAEQPRSVNLEGTSPIGNYPPPTGSPFLYPSPPPAEDPSAATSPLIPPPRQGNGLRRLSAGAISAIAAAALAIAMVAALLGGVAGGFLVSRTDGGSASLPPAPAGSAVRPKGSIADIASRVLPSVVTIKVVGPAGSGTGSGFVMRQDGYILTNNHVVEAATAKGKITVLFSDGQSSDATIIGQDASYILTNTHIVEAATAKGKITVLFSDGQSSDATIIGQDASYILTNNHVVEAATAKGKITVLFSDGQSSDATIIGQDASYDLAVIRVDRRN